MTAVAEQIYKKAVNLNPIDRAELIEKLFSTFSQNQNPKIEQAWKKEVVRRKEAYENGDIEASSMENVFERLAKR